MIPKSSDVPDSIDGMTEEQVQELATHYLDLLKLLLDGINVCESDTATVRWSGRGFLVDGHGIAS